MVIHSSETVFRLTHIEAITLGKGKVGDWASVYHFTMQKFTYYLISEAIPIEQVGLLLRSLSIENGLHCTK